MGVLISFDAAGDRALCGGKGANLAFLAGLGLRVPDGAVLPATVFRSQVAACGAASDLAAALTARPLDEALRAELSTLVARLGGRVSVRSSATLEDARTHSFAGQFLTVLNVGEDGIEAAVRAVWASAFSENVRAYLRRAELDPERLHMAVVVQRQLASAASGVAMGRPGGVVVEAVLGQGEALVSGEVPADHWEVDGERISSQRLSLKPSRWVLPDGAPNGRLEAQEVPMEERALASLTDAQVLEVAASCQRIASAAEGRPQDCEFSYVDGVLHLLQTRDVTASLPVSAPPLGDFVAPGKGAWELDTAHFVRPCTRLFQEFFPVGMKAGFSKATLRYGALLSHGDAAFVQGFAYMRMRPVAAPEDATTKPPPPAWLFKILMRVVPAIRRRLKAAEQIWITREWRTQLQEWEAQKAGAVKEHLRLQQVDCTGLDDAALLQHFRAVCAHATAMVEQHHTYNMAALIPLGDLLARVAAWSGGQVSAAEVFSLITGATPISADLRSAEARRVGASLAASPEARRLLRLDDPTAVVSDAQAADDLVALRGLSAEVGAQTAAFLASREYRLVEGLDPGAPCLWECPGLLWQGLRTAALGADGPEPSVEIDARALAQVRERIPAQHHEALDALLAEARVAAPLRDERALYSDVWAWGILRSVVLQIGRRLHHRSPQLLVDASDLIHASADEIASLLTRSEGPSATELAARSAFRRSYTVGDAPVLLGPPPLPPPSSALLPPGAARLTDALMTVLPHVISPAVRESGGATLRGCPAAGGQWEGPAHVVNSHADAQGIAPGSVLVVGAGSSTFTMLAPLAAAVVAEGGGLLCHVAIVCREYRIPCVCGCPGVLSSIKTGQRLRVDGTKGTVEIVEPAAQSA